MGRGISLDSIDITPALREGTKIITSYSSSYFRVGEEKFEHNIIISPSICSKYQEIEDLEIHLAATSNIILLYGVNEREQEDDFANELKKKFPDHNISLEIMPMRSAARTYNILVTEGRDVVAILELEK